jgi:hypothetical protein
MRLVDPALQAALVVWRTAPEAEPRAEADNLWFEERVSGARQAAFETRAAGAADAATLRRRQVDYVKDAVQITGQDPHTFQAAFAPADLGALARQPIIRLESLREPLKTAGLSFTQLSQALTIRDQAVLTKFLTQWNNDRDWRPAFAAFRDEVEDDLAAPDWALRLRTRLGLAHYDTGKGPLPVALMQYDAIEVRKVATARGLACAFTAPTAVDSGPWPWFFPAPPELVCGRSMPLEPVMDDSLLVAEVLHARIDYRPEHLIAVAEITQPLGALDVRALRNHHLLAVRIASDRDDFGEDIPR